MLYALPTASEVRIASRLRPEQVSSAFTGIDALEADIEGRIQEQASYVRRRLMLRSTPLAWPLTSAQVATSLPLFTSEQQQEWRDAEVVGYSESIKTLSLGSLYESAGQLNPRYQAQAEDYYARGMRMLDQLADEVARVAGMAHSGDEPADPALPRSHSGRVTAVWH
ncbi:MAG TPA: hypothetical protein VNM48_09035 [Chloroflexota bacterium]|nr:hypothetical protein [Chloroflexota bacterium]